MTSASQGGPKRLAWVCEGNAMVESIAASSQAVSLLANGLHEFIDMVNRLYRPKRARWCERRNIRVSVPSEWGTAGEYDFPEARCASGQVTWRSQAAASCDSIVAPPMGKYFDILKQYDASEIDQFFVPLFPTRRA